MGYRRSVHRRLGVAVLGAAACGLFTEPEWVVHVGQIAVDEAIPATITVPSIVTARVEFEIGITTFGSSSCTRPAAMDISVVGLTATVTPLDSGPRPGRDVICTSDLRSFPRSGILTFMEPGRGTIQVVGRVGDRDTTITRALIVQ